MALGRSGVELAWSDARTLLGLRLKGLTEKAHARLRTGLLAIGFLSSRSDRGEWTDAVRWEFGFVLCVHQ